MVPLIWLIVALALAGAEALTGDLFLLDAQRRRAGRRGSSLLFDELWIDGVVFLVVSMLLLVLVRPALRRRFAGHRACRSRIKALEGKSALVLGPGGAARRPGETRRRGLDGTAAQRRRCLRTGRPCHRHAHRRRDRGRLQDRLSLGRNRQWMVPSPA